MFRDTCTEKHFRNRHEFMGDFFGRGAERFGRERQRGRFFDNGDLRFVILQLLTEKARSGYEIMKTIEELSGGTYVPSPGVVYPTLTMLEEQEYITITANDGNKKIYGITDAGLVALNENRSAVDELFGRMAHAGRSHGHQRPPQLLRAIENLKATLKLKALGSVLSSQQIEKIAAILDGAAKEIEQL